jgi:hypothetical protein
LQKKKVKTLKEKNSKLILKFGELMQTIMKKNQLLGQVEWLYQKLLMKNLLVRIFFLILS